MNSLSDTTKKGSETARAADDLKGVPRPVDGHSCSISTPASQNLARPADCALDGNIRRKTYLLSAKIRGMRRGLADYFEESTIDAKFLLARKLNKSGEKMKIFTVVGLTLALSAGAALAGSDNGRGEGKGKAIAGLVSKGGDFDKGRANEAAGFDRGWGQAEAVDVANPNGSSKGKPSD